MTSAKFDGVKFVKEEKHQGVLYSPLAVYLLTVCVTVAAVKTWLVSLSLTDKWLFNDYWSFPSTLQTSLCWFYRGKDLINLLISGQEDIISRCH